MTKNELAGMVHSNISELMIKNSEKLYSEYCSLLDAINSKNSYQEPFFTFYTSAAEFGAMAAMQTLINLKILDISE